MQSPTIPHLLTGLVIAGIVAAVSVRHRLLSPGGGLAATAIGSLVFGLGGIPWSMPLLAFFVPASLVSSVPWQWHTAASPDSVHESAYEKGSRRDARQVIANGGVAAAVVVLALLHCVPNGYVLFGASLAAAAGDTWGTEVGGTVGGHTVSVATLKRVAPGTSGGVSIVGTLGCLIGSGMVGLAGSPWYASPVDLLVVTASGCFGTVIDSVVGATLQRRHRCPACGRVVERVEHCGVPTSYARGIRFVDNDVVNMIATLSAALCAAAFTQLGR